ncbi:hypothetical protein FKP32DRAFT_1609133 [Trametes sanguinea]|nr:hypothetical protein FKP32DRAFT_1609133 [Trametes sanguinea]
MNPDKAWGQPEPGVSLRKTRAGQPEGFTKGSVFTTPNQQWVPEFAIAHSEITTYADGHWGRHEYSRWPQAYARDCFHVACIPRNPSLDGPSAFSFRTFRPEDWKVEDCGIRNVGFLKPKVLKPLELEAPKAIQCLMSCHRNWKEWNGVGQFLTVCLRHTLDRVRVLPAPQSVTISLAAHVQRLTYGLRNLLNVVLGHLESQHDFTSDVLDILGAHTLDPSIAQVLFRAGVPVWFQQPLTTCVAIYQVISRTVWQHTTGAMVRRQLCPSSLPQLDRLAQDDVESPSKHIHEDAFLSTVPSSQCCVPAFALSPFRQHYSSSLTFISVAWARALSGVGRLPQPPQSVTYFYPPYPPPWNLHHMVCIRTFCRLRLFDSTIAGRPLTISEWCDALDNVQRLFGGVAALRSYDSHAKPELDGHVVRCESDRELQHRLVWEVHEVNWRCEVLSLDALMVGFNQWPKLALSCVWGHSTSGMEDSGEDWEGCRRHMQAFINILVCWLGCPDELLHAPPSVSMDCDTQEYSRLMHLAIDFYVRTFIVKYRCMPVPPVRGIPPIAA